jgi:glycine dehydrogenase
MMGTEGLTFATKAAILNANYLAACLKDTYGIVYRGAKGFVGHEMILECRTIAQETGISENDIAKRLMDYGYHAPTLSFPVHGTLMVEPTESESLAELDNFVEVMKTIYAEIEEIKTGKADKTDNVLLNAPHPEYEIVSDKWDHCYGREKAAYPIQSVRDNKFWINVARVDNTLGRPSSAAYAIRHLRIVHLSNRQNNQGDASFTDASPFLQVYTETGC